MQIQTVLYRATARDVDAFVQSVRAAMRLAVQTGTVRSVDVAVGDSSPHRTLTAARELEVSEQLTECGVQAFHYEFYDENRGSAGGQNVLFDRRRAGTDFVFVVNPDLYLSPDVLGELLGRFDAPDIGIVEARQLPMEHPKAYDPIDGSTSWASGACMMIRAEVLEQIRGFDNESFFLYCDDVDFSWRTRLAGYRILHQLSARVFHDKRIRADGKLLTSETERYYAAEASLLMAWKYSRPDLVAEWSTVLLASDAAEHHRAVESFRRREHDAHLPTPIDPDGRVAEFVGNFYGPHRYLVSV